MTQQTDSQTKIFSGSCKDLFPFEEEYFQSKNAQGEPEGLVFNVQGHSIHDGPGARTTVFMAGCPLRCNWCCNPEGLWGKPQLMTKSKSCMGCGRCVQACPRGGMSSKDGVAFPIRAICDKCTTFECVEACFREAIYVSAKTYKVSELARIFQRDRSFWGATGGVSFSGGEPLMQKKFMLPMLKKCKEMAIHVCIETTACLESKYFQEAVSYVDWVFVDIKHMNSDKHKQVTGVPNELILKNISDLAQRADWNGIIMPRIPVIPGINDSLTNIRATGRFVRGIGLDAINLLPFHRLGESKYRQLGREYMFADDTPPDDEYMRKLQTIMNEEGLLCYLGWETPF